MIANCAACESSRRRPFSGAYSLRCRECCARLVASTYPNRQHARAMLETVGRFMGTNSGVGFTAEDVTARAREIVGWRRADDAS